MAEANAKPSTETPGGKANKPRPSAKVDLAKLGVKAGKQWNAPMLKLVAGDEYAVETLDHSEKVIPGANTDEPAIILRCTDMTNGELIDLIVPTVLESTLIEAYGAERDSWKGKKLYIRASKREGKRYTDVVVQELS